MTLAEIQSLLQWVKSGGENPPDEAQGQPFWRLSLPPCYVQQDAPCSSQDDPEKRKSMPGDLEDQAHARKLTNVSESIASAICLQVNVLKLHLFEISSFVCMIAAGI